MHLAQSRSVRINLQPYSEIVHVSVDSKSSTSASSRHILSQCLESARCAYNLSFLMKGHAYMEAVLKLLLRCQCRCLAAPEREHSPSTSFVACLACLRVRSPTCCDRRVAVFWALSVASGLVPDRASVTLTNEIRLHRACTVCICLFSRLSMPVTLAASDYVPAGCIMSSLSQLMHAHRPKLSQYNMQRNI